MATLKLNLTNWNPPNSILKPHPLFYDNGVEPAAGGFDQMINDIRDDLAALNQDLLSVGSNVDLHEWFIAEVSGERGAVFSQLNGFPGAVFRKSLPQGIAAETFYFRAPTHLEQSSVYLLLSSNSASSGNVALSVGVANSLNGPFTTYYPNTAPIFDPTLTQPQLLTIPTGTLTAAKPYYYRVSREYGSVGDTLNSNVIIAGIKVI